MIYIISNSKLMNIDNTKLFSCMPGFCFFLCHSASGSHEEGLASRWFDESSPFEAFKQLLPETS